jgi:hypothetical protein
LEVAEMPMESPPTKVDWPPSGPGMAATPTLTLSLSGIWPRVVEGIGMTPMTPLGK